MHAALLFLMLLQSPSGDPEAAPMSRLEHELALSQLGSPNTVSSQEAERRAAAYQELQFVEKFNKLATALTDFGHEYNRKRVIDARKIKAIKKAWRELEKTDLWFAGKERK